MLSDLLDVRRGEIPHTDGTALARPGVRADLELHLVACEPCREELRAMEEVGAAFAEFTVDEPPAQHFANYVGIVRARLKHSGQAVAQAPASVSRKGGRRIIWGITFGASALAAASLFLVLTKGLPIFEKPSQLAAGPGTQKTGPRRLEGIRQFPKVVLSAPAISAFVPNGPQLQPLPVDDVPSLRGLQESEGRFGFLVVGEKTRGDARPLLGVLLKTTRDVDRVADERLGLMIFDVIPGSPAQAMGLKKGDHIVTANDLPLDNGGTEEILKFFNGIKQAGEGANINLQVIRPIGEHHLFMVKEGVLGEYAP